MTNPDRTHAGDGEPLPCPFCGGEAEILHLEDCENVGGSCVSCTQCQASGNVEFGRKENFVSNFAVEVANAVNPPVTEDGIGKEDHTVSCAAQSDAQSAPVTDAFDPLDWVMVPREPTRAMASGGRQAYENTSLEGYGRDEAIRDAWAAMIAAAPPQTEVWRPIETAPRDGTEFIAYRPDAGAFAATWHHPAHEDGGWDVEAEPVLFSASGEDLTDITPTHWLPLPAPPPTSEPSDGKAVKS